MPLNRKRKSLNNPIVNVPFRFIKGQGEPCKQGETAENTGCIPASGEAKPKKTGREESGEPVSRTEDRKPVKTVTDEDRARLGVGEAIDITTGGFQSPQSYSEEVSKAVEIVPDDIKEAIRYYSKGGDQKLLKAMRKHAPNFDQLPPDLREMLDKIDRAFSLMPPFEEAINTYRGMDVSPEVKEQIITAAEKALASGDSFVFPSLVSTTVNPRTARRFAQGKKSGKTKIQNRGILFKIRSTHGIPMDDPSLSHFSGTGSEREILLSHKSIFRVIGVEEADLTVRSAWSGTGRVEDRVEVIYLEQIS